jgi:hypothetical protein
MDDDQRPLTGHELGNLLVSAVRNAQDEPVVARPHADRGD